MLNEKTIREIKAYKDYTGRQLPIELVEECMNEMDKQGHSGFSANYVFAYLKHLIEDEAKTKENLDGLEKKDDSFGMQHRINNNIRSLWEIISKVDDTKDKYAMVNLLAFEPTAPLLGTEDEWKDSCIFDESEKRKSQQNARKSSVFREWFEELQEWIAYDINANTYSDDGGNTFFSTGRFGREQITFPYDPQIKAHYLFEYEEDCYIHLTDQKTINKLKEKCKSKYED